MRSSLLIKIQVKKSDPWVRNCLMALRSRTVKAKPGT